MTASTPTLAAQLATAPNHATRAGLLLEAPMGIVLHHAGALCAACTQARFTPGVDYVAAVSAALLSKRSAEGRWKDHHTATVDGLAAMLTRFVGQTDTATLALMARYDAKRGAKNTDLAETSPYRETWDQTRTEVESDG